MSPDPKTVREIARKVIERASLRRDYIGSVISDHAVMAEILASGDRTAYGKLRAAVVIEQATATVTVSWPDEQQPADVVTAEQQQDGAVEEVRTFLDTLPPRIDIVADWTRNGVRTELTAEALRAVLAERAQMAKLLGIGTDPEQWDAIAEAEGRRFEGEQANDTLVGYLAYQRESSRALSSFLQSEVKELEAERTALAARVAELEAERDLWRTRAYQVGNMVIGERDPEVVPFLWAPGQESTATETEES